MSAERKRQAVGLNPTMENRLQNTPVLLCSHLFSRDPMVVCDRKLGHLGPCAPDNGLDTLKAQVERLITACTILVEKAQKELSNGQ